MNVLQKKIILITGATSGIGRACALKFAEAGANIIVTGRREERLGELASEIENQYKTKVKAAKLDVRDWTAAKQFIDTLPEDWKRLDVLVNNAGLSRGLDKIHEGSIKDWEEMIETNIKGLLYMSRAVIPGMVQRNNGTIINIGSIAGREVYPKGNVYCATKHAVDAITKGMRLDLMDTSIRVCTVDPGLVETEFSLVRFRGDEQRAKIAYEGIKPLTSDDVADAVLYVASRPSHVQVAELLLLPTDQASTTVINRKLDR